MESRRSTGVSGEVCAGNTLRPAAGPPVFFESPFAHKMPPNHAGGSAKTSCESAMFLTPNTPTLRRVQFTTSKGDDYGFTGGCMKVAVPLFVRDPKMI